MSRRARADSVPRYLTPLRYPGGKQRLGWFFAEVLALNKLISVRYVEPFAGGAGAALYLLRRGLVNSIHLNDLDRSVFAFWYAATQCNPSLCQLLERTPITVDEWDRQKEVQRHKSTAPLLELGFSTLFLNRTNRSGILRAGMIGGRAQSGRWKLDARFDKSRILSRLQELRKLARHISVDCMDAIEFLSASATTRSRERTLVYLDPPYITKGDDLYWSRYALADHEELAAVVKHKLSCPWIVTYDDNTTTRRLYKGFVSRSYQLAYTADTKRIGTELMAISKGIRVPRL